MAEFPDVFVQFVVCDFISSCQQQQNNKKKPYRIYLSKAQNRQASLCSFRVEGMNVQGGVGGGIAEQEAALL